MKSPYDRRLVPSAPSVLVRIGAPGEALTIGPFEALLDTGADICILPSTYLAPLNLPADDERYLRPFGGTRRRVWIYTLDLGIGRLRLPSIEVVADEVEPEAVLGRNVLNKLMILLDGPSEVVDIHEA